MANKKKVIRGNANMVIRDIVKDMVTRGYTDEAIIRKLRKSYPVMLKQGYYQKYIDGVRALGANTTDE